MAGDFNPQQLDAWVDRYFGVPTTSALTTGMQTTWRVVIDGPDGTNLYDGPKPVTLAIRAAASTGRLQLWSKPTMYDQYRGIFRITTSASAPTVTVVNDSPRRCLCRAGRHASGHRHLRVHAARAGSRAFLNKRVESAGAE